MVLYILIFFFFVCFCSSWSVLFPLIFQMEVIDKPTEGLFVTQLEISLYKGEWSSTRPAFPREVIGIISRDTDWSTISQLAIIPQSKCIKADFCINNSELIHDLCYGDLFDNVIHDTNRLLNLDWCISSQYIPRMSWYHRDYFLSTFADEKCLLT